MAVLNSIREKSPKFIIAGAAFVFIILIVFDWGLDLSGRPHLTFNAKLPSGKRFIGAFDVDLTQDFFQALVNHARICLHVNVRYGRNLHHVVEAIFKATARALRAATAREGTALPSTKGVL